MARQQFLRLPAPTRRALLAAVGRFSPWDPRFDHGTAPEAHGLGVGPPDVVGIGVQKAGTTWWHSLLARHPGFYTHPAVHKELHYFARFCTRELTDADISTYHRWFPRPAGLLTGEWTPDYLCQDWVPTLLQQAAPDARLLVILRDPTDRYRSGLEHVLTDEGRITPIMAADAFRRGLYADDLERYAALWGRERMLVLQYERCRDDPAGELARTLRFVGLDDTWRPEDLAAPVNRTEARRSVDLPPRRRRELAAAYAADLARLAGLYPEIDLDRWPTARLASSGR